MLYPKIDKVNELLKDYKTVPVFYELLMDSYTPIQLFNCLHEAYDDCFILESVDNKNQWGRYSYIGIDPKAEYVLKDHIITVREKGKDTKTIKVDNFIEFFSDIIEAHKSPRFNNYPKLRINGIFCLWCYKILWKNT